LGGFWRLEFSWNQRSMPMALYTSLIEMIAQWRRNEVLSRDNKQCTVVHANGKRCKEKRWLHIHHILAKSQGGGDHVDNLTTLCVNHHRLIHFQSGWKEDQRTKRLIFSEKRRQEALNF